MNKIYFQGTYGAYSHLAALSIDSKAKIIPCKTFDECFLKASTEENSKIGTLAAHIRDDKMYENKNVVKVKIKESFNQNSFPVAENFFRNLQDQKKKDIYHHIGIYCYELQTLKKFVTFKQSKNELQNRLEQLRALDNGLNINVGLASKSPIGVDTDEDFLAIKKIMKYK